MQTFSEKFDEIMKPPKFLKELEGNDCFVCGHPMPNSRGAELLKSFFSSQVAECLKEIEKEVEKTRKELMDNGGNVFLDAELVKEIIKKHL